MKIRIFKLAKELGLDHKELVAICGEVGVAVKSSPLASITPEQKDLVTEHLKSRSAPKPAVEATAAPMAPVRDEDGVASSRMRTMRTMTARPSPRTRPQAAGTESEEAAEVVGDDAEKVESETPAEAETVSEP